MGRFKCFLDKEIFISREERLDRRVWEEMLEIEQVLRPIRGARPFRTGVEFYSDEITDLTVFTIANAAEKLDFGGPAFRAIRDSGTPVHVGSYRNRTLQLKTCPGRRNVFE